MLHKETIEKSTLELLNQLMGDVSFSNFVLAGGTALALQIGHRISVDLDLFSSQPFNAEELADYLRTNYGFELDFISTNTIKGELNGVQLDCIAHQYPWIDKSNDIGEIRLASLTDIAAMKLNAIAGNGTRIKDFVDIAFLSSKISLNQMLEAYEKKYKSNTIMPLKALVFYNDINFNEPIKMTGNKHFEWNPIEKRLRLMYKLPNKIFELL
jgi:predicted nucleotidyltransferase component of viral defense system